MTWLGYACFAALLAGITGFIPIFSASLGILIVFVIGRVVDILMSGWRIDINCPYSSVLPLKDATFDFSDPGNVDCLVCHDTTGTYKKLPAAAGHPASRAVASSRAARMRRAK